MKRWQGLKKLIHDAVDHTTDLVEDTQDLAAGKTLGYLDLLGPVGEASRAVEGIRKVTSAGVFASIHGINRLVDAVTDLGFDVARQRLDDPAKAKKESEVGMAEMRSDIVGSAGWLGDAALGALNGVVGDHLHSTDNGLDLGFSLRCRDRVVEAADGSLAAALADHRGKLVVFVHGLCTTEWCWCMNAQEYYGDPRVSFGSQLEAELGFLPLFARYNSGRHIWENGRLFAEHLQRLLDTAREIAPVDQLLLVGHSMGGLVIRNACQVAREEAMTWLEPLTHAVYLGSPHRGAPLEKLGSAVTAVLRFFDVPGTVVPARVIDLRSAGIKDLRFGRLTDDEHVLDVPLLEGVTHAFISATLTREANHPLGDIVGDILVGAKSAAGPEERRDTFRIETRHFGEMHHLELQNHPDVYAQLRQLIQGSDQTSC